MSFRFMVTEKHIRPLLRSGLGIEPDRFEILHLPGDASNRTYHRVRLPQEGGAQTFILMELSEPEAFKKSEEQVSGSTVPIVELPFLNIQSHLAKNDVRVPKLYGHDQKAGLLLLQDLGDLTLELEIRAHVGDRDLIRRHYRTAIQELLKIQVEATHPPNPDCIAFGRAFDVPLLMWEFDHFLEYGIEAYKKAAIRPADRDRIRKTFHEIAEELSRLPRCFTHRDYHSRNLMVHESSIYLLDFQDALMGPPMYDLASLLRDSYTVLPEPLVEELLEFYLDGYRARSGVRLEPGPFRRLFDRMSLQRNLKAAGRFVYIDRVKKNDRFLPYIPQTLGYVKRNLERYPELAGLKALLGAYLEEVR
jgi:aminoglycoside/choline kinase family phosphotransferase